MIRINCLNWAQITKKPSCDFLGQSHGALMGMREVLLHLFYKAHVFKQLPPFILTKHCFWYRDAEEIPLTERAVFMAYLCFGTADSDNQV